MNIRIKSQIAIVALTLLMMTACSRTEEKVVATYGNGQPKIVQSFKGKGDKQQRVGEKAYYEDGTAMYVQHYKDNMPDGKWQYYHANGTLFAKGDFRKNHEKGSDWLFFDPKGDSLFHGAYDSIAIMQSAADHRPLSIAYCSGSDEMRYEFNENYTLHAKGKVSNDKKEGRWEFYYANGQLQLEAMYKNDITEGAYNSYRETGIPYFRGYYINGLRAGIWEFYDANGDLAGRQDFDKK